MIDVRRARPADAPAMARLLAQLGYPMSAELVPGRLAAVEGDGGVAFVAQDEKVQIVGLASGTCYATLHGGGRVAYITALVTAEDARGRGVGRALVAAIESWAVGLGCTRLAVTSAERRADAHAFYPRCGLPCTGRRFSKQLKGSAEGLGGEGQATR
jgi:GNAT superfamily N-acetyltransferase